MNELPTEIVQLVLSFTDAKTKRFFRQTCTRLFEITDLREFTFYFTRSNTIPQIVQTLSRYSQPLNIRFSKSINLKPHAINLLSALTTITSLTFDQNFTEEQTEKMMDLTRLTDLQILDLRRRPAVIWRCLKNLRKISGNFQSSSITYEVLKSNPNLQHLDLDVLGSFSHIQNIDHVLSLVLTSFRDIPRMDFRILKQAHRLTHLRLFNCPVEIPYRSLTTLKSLKLLFYLPEACSNFSDLAYLNLEHLSLDGVLHPDSVQTWTVLTTLKELFIIGCTTIPDMSFLTALCNLSSFSLTRSEGSVSNFKMEFLPDSLTYLEVNGLIDGITHLTGLQSLLVSDYLPGSQNYECLTALPNLTKLSVDLQEESNSIKCISEMTSLKDLAIYSYDSVVDDGYFNLSKLINLESLDLPSILLTSITLRTMTSLSNLTSLKRIYDIRDEPHILETLPLKNLEVEHEQNEEFWQSLVQITTLESLKLRHINSPEIIVSLSALRNLTFLEVISTILLSYTCLTHLTSLQSINFPTLKGITSAELMDLMPLLYSTN